MFKWTFRSSVWKPPFYRRTFWQVLRKNRARKICQTSKTDELSEIEKVREENIADLKAKFQATYPGESNPFSNKWFLHNASLHWIDLGGSFGFQIENSNFLFVLKDKSKWNKLISQLSKEMSFIFANARIYDGRFGEFRLEKFRIVF